MALFEKFLVRQKKITCDSLLGSPCTILLLYNYFVLCKFLLPIRFRFKSGISALMRKGLWMWLEFLVLVLKNE